MKINSEGFTLIETIVTVFIFSLIALVVGAVFVDALNLQGQAFNVQVAEENANFTMESMAKEIRVAQITSPDADCPSSPVTTLSIIHPVNGNITYYLLDNAIHRVVNGVDTVISSNRVQFTRLQFCISGSPSGDQKQPRVTILASVRGATVRGRGAKTQQWANIDFQTTLSQRFLSN